MPVTLFIVNVLVLAIFDASGNSLFGVYCTNMLMTVLFPARWISHMLKSFESYCKKCEGNLLLRDIPLDARKFPGSSRGLHKRARVSTMPFHCSPKSAVMVDKYPAQVQEPLPYCVDFSVQHIDAHHQVKHPFPLVAYPVAGYKPDSSHVVHFDLLGSILDAIHTAELAIVVDNHHTGWDLARIAWRKLQLGCFLDDRGLCSSWTEQFGRILVALGSRFLGSGFLLCSLVLVICGLLFCCSASFGG